MILADTDILSAMAKIARLPLLFSLLKTNNIYVAPGVFSELKRSLDLGRKYAQDIFSLFDAGQISIAHLMPDEIAFRDTLPATLGTGERESIAIARCRKSAILSNESRVAIYVDSPASYASACPTFCARYGLKASFPNRKFVLWSTICRSEIGCSLNQQPWTLFSLTLDTGY